MKTFLTMLAAMFMTFGVIGCGGGDDTDTTTDDATEGGDGESTEGGEETATE